MKKNIFKHIISFALCASMCFIPVKATEPDEAVQNASDAATNAQSTAVVSNKNEAIYATIQADGEVQGIYSVNHFELSSFGTITDYGDYDSVVNLTSSEPIETDGDKVTLSGEKDNVYYQGNLESRDLPWKFSIQYLLDGKAVASSELAGKSGELEIKIKSEKNPSVDSSFYDNYMLQISLTLDSEKCGNIEAPDATIGSAGKNQSINYTVMPGSNADIVIKSSVKDFSMAGIDITAMPFSMNMEIEISNTDDLIGEFDLLADAVSELNDGIKELSKGTSELASGSSELKDGSLEIKKGLVSLKNNSGELVNGSSQIKSALSSIVNSLGEGNSNSADLSELTKLPQGLSELTSGLDEISAGLKKLNEGFTPAYTALDNAINGIPDASLTDEEIAGLYAGADASLQPALNTLMDYYKAGKTVKGVYEQVKAAFSSVNSSLTQLSGSIDTISSSIKGMLGNMSSSLGSLEGMDQLPLLLNGLKEISNNYASFHKGLLEYVGGVGKISDGYSEFQNGIGTLTSGTKDLSSGTSQMYEGSVQLNEEVSKIPDSLQEEIDKLYDQYTSSEYSPVSFLSSKNKNVSIVQFVIKSEGIEAEKAEDEATLKESESDTFWDRFTALFAGKAN